jgi:NADP-dependent aldehyde dehydrogenase
MTTMDKTTASSAVLPSLDPRTGRELGQVRVTPSSELERILDAAGNIFEAEQSGRTFSDSYLLHCLADQLDCARSELLRIADEETALGYTRLNAEIDRTQYQLRAFADLSGSAALLEPVIDTADPERVPPRADVRRLNAPLGPVAVFAASNFPFAFGVLGGDTASALAAGCPAVIKAHTAQPRLGARIADLALEALRTSGAPAEWLQVIFGGGHATGQLLVSHPVIRAVGFTGSYTGGRALVQAAAERQMPIPVYAEMGSLNPVFVAPQAARERVAQIAAEWAACITASAGQLCTKPGLLVLPDPESARTAAAIAGKHVQAAEIPPMLAPRLRTGFAEALEVARSVQGVQIAGGPMRINDRPGTWQAGAVLTVDAATVLANPALLVEMFGPAGVIVAASSSEEAMALAHAMPGSLTGTVHANENDHAWASAALSSLRQSSGRLIVNGWPTGLSVGFATVHGGPWPATSAPHTTSVGMAAARRFVRPVAYQHVPDDLLPLMLRDANPLGAERLVDGVVSAAALCRQSGVSSDNHGKPIAGSRSRQKK